MNYGDKLRQMTNEEMAKEIWLVDEKLDGDCGFHIESILHYLNTEIETTGHEDLEKLNFMFAHECHHNNLPEEEYIQYRHRFSGGIFRIYRESI